jgi:dipeptidyl-peptidase-4
MPRLPAALLILALAQAAAAAELTVERLFDPPDLQGETLRSLRFSPDGRLVSYLKPRAEDTSAFDLWAYDIARREHRLLVDARALVPAERALSAEEEARRERARIASLRGIVDYAWSPAGDALLFPLDGDLYWVTLGAGGPAVRPLTATAAYETDPKISPAGRYVSFIRDQDLWVLELATGAERAITTDGEGPVSNGVAEFIAQEEMDRATGYWWSPDERRIAYARVDESPVAEVERFEVLADRVQVVRQRYPAAGTANALVTLHVAELDTGATRALDLGADTDIYLARVHWYPESDALLVQRQSRDQKRLDLLRMPADGQAPRLLFSETSDSWVELHDELRFLPSRRQFIWASQRSGHRHLYLYGYGGRLLGALTAGPWDVDADGTAALRGVDEGRGTIYFMATADTPLERHLYAARLDRGDPARPRRLTEAGRWHDVAMSPDLARFATTSSDPMTPPQVSLHAISGRRLAWIAENALDAAHPYAPYVARHVAPEFGTLPAADGTPLNWQLLRPAGFDAARRYPAVVIVYGGPGVQTVQRRFGDRRGSLFAQLLARRGYAVFMLDNRGSSGRGQTFAAALHGRLGSVEVEDQLRGVDHLRSLPWIDPARIGVFGWSYGGYMSLLMLMRAPEAFAAGVSGAPVTDWRLYDTHYTERYLGDPAEAATAYEAASVLAHAEGLDSRLLLIHGMADDNVLFTHSTLLIDRLVKLGKRFEVLPYPGAKHGLLRFPDTGRHGWNSILDFFDRHLGPGPGVAAE